MLIESSFWRNRKVLVTGHTGFVGTWLSLMLKHWGADVTGFALEEELGALYGKIKKKLDIKSVYGDLRDMSAIRTCVEKTKPEIVFHIAAYGFVKECYKDPERAYSSNVQGTLNLFQALRREYCPCRIIVASSDKVYKNSGVETYLFKEEDSLGGIDPYSASKTCEDILAQSCYDSYFHDNGSLVIVRPSNILGGGDHNMNRLIPSIYYNLSRGLEPTIRNPASIRPWQNIFDIVDAYMTVAEQVDAGCRIYNVGPETEGIKTVGEIAAYVTRLYGRTVNLQEQEHSDVKEKEYLGLSIEKIKKELDWKPKRPLEQTLDEIYEFYNRDDGHNTYDICMSQIKRYYQ